VPSAQSPVLSFGPRSPCTCPSGARARSGCVHHSLHWCFWCPCWQWPVPQSLHLPLWRPCWQWPVPQFLHWLCRRPAVLALLSGPFRRPALPTAKPTIPLAVASTAACVWLCTWRYNLCCASLIKLLDHAFGCAPCVPLMNEAPPMDRGPLRRAQAGPQMAGHLAPGTQHAARAKPPSALRRVSKPREASVIPHSPVL
jgi:hypothetical protein